MSREVIEMAREAGFLEHEGTLYTNHKFGDCFDELERFAELVRADERNRWEHNYEVLMNALWKACGDDAKMVEETIKSQGELK